MAVAVGRAVVFPKVSSSAGEVRAHREVSPRVAFPSTSGRGVIRHVKLGRPNVGFRAIRATSNGAARDHQLFVEHEVAEFVASNALQVPDVGRDKSGAAHGVSLLTEFEGLLTMKSQEVSQLNQGSPIFLVGMMASGKSTVGRVVADGLGFSFFDSDDVIESFVGGLPVKEIFRQKGEAEFRDLETRALRELCLADSLVVATGGGAVMRDENWDYLLDGITVWLDVPVEELARRVTTAGTESRPLLGGGCDFENAFSKLSQLMDVREQYYSRSHCRLSFRDLASKLHLSGVHALTPTAIAVQVLEEITQVVEKGLFIPPPIGY